MRQPVADEFDHAGRVVDLIGDRGGLRPAAANARSLAVRIPHPSGNSTIVLRRARPAHAPARSQWMALLPRREIGSLASGLSSTPGKPLTGKRDEREIEPPLSDLFWPSQPSPRPLADPDLDDQDARGGTRASRPGEVDGPHPLGLHRAEHDRPADPPDRVDGVASGRCRGKRGAGLGQQHAPGIGQLDPVGRAIKQAARRARARGCAPRRRPRIARRGAIRGTREAALLGDGDKGARAAAAPRPRGYRHHAITVSMTFALSAIDIGRRLGHDQTTSDAKRRGSLIERHPMQTTH